MQFGHEQLDVYRVSIGCVCRARGKLPAHLQQQTRAGPFRTIYDPRRQLSPSNAALIRRRHRRYRTIFTLY